MLTALYKDSIPDSKWRKKKYLWESNSKKFKSLYCFYILNKHKAHSIFIKYIYFLVWKPKIYISLIMEVKVKLLSGVRLFVTPWTVAYQAPPSMGFSRQEYWSGLPFPSPGDLPDPGIKPRSPVLEADALTSEPPEKILPDNIYEWFCSTQSQVIQNFVLP